MLDRRLWLAGLGAAIAVPYFAMDGNVPQWLQSQRAAAFGDGSSADADPFGFAAVPIDPPASADPLATPLVSLEEALRYDVQPAWVLSRWPRVGTIVGELEWAGMRVPLITGYEPTDFVGSLTYYFDRQQRLRRIAVEGFTGDERRFAALVVEQFGLYPEANLHGGLYVYRWNNEPISVMCLQYAPLVSAATPQARRRVVLELNTPMAGCRLSPELRGMLAATELTRSP